MTNPTRGWQAFALIAASWPSAVWAAASHVALPGGGELWLDIPAGWDEKFDSPQKGMAPGVWLTPRQGASFNILITPLAGTPMGEAVADDVRMRAIVASAARDALSHAVETTIPVQSLSGPHAHIVYLFATDRAPAPGEWKYLTQGMVSIDGVPFAFTILTNDGQEAVSKGALELIRNASYHRASG
jgi:hypothetical protein